MVQLILSKSDEDSMTEKVLGMHWNILEDTLTFKSERDKGNKDIVTKRKILSRISSIYDPLGLL